ncbi:hypothetical protein CSE16_20075 [Solibacillus sp. R5-41]|uniref:hypothetical protein n=1 Tax=Solibacillus sp. R5-41 TaxID=2048654 RepID=UPI000C128548|nr:hypothetical protein [Solibacillus sp. R5-41]ATP42122.1 hypothetical protein CSE16_20075 [Solibacillus sp. R5-41]
MWAFIVEFNIAKPHFSIAPEGEGIDCFDEEIMQAGYEHRKKYIKIKWDKNGNCPNNLLRILIWQ